MFAAHHAASFERGADFHRVMTIIINDGHAMADPFGFKPAADTAKCGQSLTNGIGLYIHFKRDSNRGKTILYIMITQHREADVGNDRRIASGTVR